MALKSISENSTPAFIALSTDIVDNKIAGASLVGKTVLTTNDGEWYIIKDDLTLSPYALPVIFGGTVNVGTVAIDQTTPGTTNGVVTTSKVFEVSSAISGQITVTTAGTEVQGSNVTLTNGVFIKALAGNAGVVYVGNDGAGAVTSSNGFQLSAGDMILIQVENLNELWFDSATSGDKFCWIKA